MSQSAKSGKSGASSSTSTAAFADSDATLVALYDIDDDTAHHCGYCNQNGNVSIGMCSDTMRIEDYQTLIDRGWRRSGTYIYKPTMKKTCCPLYTIRCDVLNFESRKSQKNTLKAMRRYLAKNEKRKTSAAASGSDGSSSSASGSKPAETKREKQENQKKNLIKIEPLKRDDPNRVTHAQKILQFFLDEQKTSDLVHVKSEPMEKLVDVKKLKSKHKRLFRKLLKLKEKNQISSLDDIQKHLKRKLPKANALDLESYLRVGENPANKLEIKLVRSWPASKEFEDTLNEEHKLYTKYQTLIHRDSPQECSINQFKRFLCTSPLVKTSHASGALANLAIIATSHTRCDTSITGSIAAIGYGSFHQQYRINGQLVGVGVIDILNNSVSSVYFFYDPDFNFLNMGTYSVLREIAFTRQINKLDPNIKWYYLGFYAHTCRKMRYKGFFHPSELLCPETYTWHPIERCVPRLDVNKYCRFASAEVLDADRVDNVDNVKIRIKFKDHSDYQIFKFRDFVGFLTASYVPQFARLTLGYSQLFGQKFSNRAIIKF